MFTQTQRLLRLYSILALVFALYTVIRLEFLIWNWGQFQAQSFGDLVKAFLVGWRFDLSAAMMTVAPVLLWTLVPWPANWNRFWQISTMLLFLLIQLPFLFANLVDVEFINFVGRRLSFDTLFIFREAEGKIGNFASAYWPLLVINSSLLIGFVLVSGRMCLAPLPVVKLARWRQRGAHAFLGFVSLVIFVVGIRGGLQTKPLSFVHAHVLATPALNNLILNSTFTVVKSVEEEGVKREIYFNDHHEMLKHLNGSLAGKSLLAGHRLQKPQNVMILILEGFGSEYLGEHEGRRYTPFLDELAKKSLNFTQAFANGRRSIEGIAAILAGVPAMMSEPFISSHFNSNYFWGLGSLLAERGYHTSFFHGAKNGSMYFDSFTQSAGIQNYYGSQQFPDNKQNDGVWGIWDHAFFPYMLEHVNQFQKPFLSLTFTLTSHQPYKIPEQFASVYAEGPIPILKCVAYTDDVLKSFFASAQKQPWFQDTLFVITADHTAAHFKKEYMNDEGDYRIPLMFYHPRMQWPVVDTDQIVQHIDILPSILDFLDLPMKDQNYLGSSVFAPGDKTAVVYADGRYVLFAKDYFLNWPLGAAGPMMYSRNDTNARTPLSEPSSRKDELEKRLQATIQYFGEGMWDNKLYYPSQGL